MDFPFVQFDRGVAIASSEVWLRVAVALTDARLEDGRRERGREEEGGGGRRREEEGGEGRRREEEGGGGRRREGEGQRGERECTYVAIELVSISVHVSVENGQPRMAVCKEMAIHISTCTLYLQSTGHVWSGPIYP